MRTASKTWWVEMDTSDPSEDAQDLIAVFLTYLKYENGQLEDFRARKPYRGRRNG